MSVGTVVNGQGIFLPVRISCGLTIIVAFGVDLRFNSNMGRASTQVNCVSAQTIANPFIVQLALSTSPWDVGW